MKYTIKHIHANVGLFNGSLFFLVDNRLLCLRVNTPHYNDFNEWRLSDFLLSQSPYNPEDNDVELTPYNINDIEIDEKGLKLLELGSKCYNRSCELTDEESEEFDGYEDVCLDGLAGIMYKGRENMTIGYDNDGDFVEYNLDEWFKLPDSEKSIFGKIFYPIMNEYAKYYTQLSKYKNADNIENI